MLLIKQKGISDTINFSGKSLLNLGAAVTSLLFYQQDLGRAFAMDVFHWFLMK